LLKKWPGCYIPAIPEKKVVGNSDTTFIENRRHGLESFCQEISYLPHLWYSDEFEIFLRKGGDVESSLKAIPT
jgi:sorting nexin-1/2